jgi:hypothetical protein
MDKWTETQMKLMKAGGNQQCNGFLRKHGENVQATSPATAASIRAKYESPAAELYKQVLVARVEGRPEPTELPPPRLAKKLDAGRIQGFGSSPAPQQSPAPRGAIARWGTVVAVGVAVVGIAFAVGLIPH